MNFILFNPSGEFDGVLQSSMNGNSSGGVRHESVLVPYGNFEVTVDTTGNVYAQSISSGATNLLRERLTVNPGRHTLARPHRAGRRCDRHRYHAAQWKAGPRLCLRRSYDARGFQSFPSDEHGQFKIVGLAPIEYHFFASEVQLNLDLHDPDAVRPWLQSAETRSLASGSTTSLELPVLSPTQW